MNSKTVLAAAALVVFGFIAVPVIVYSQSASSGTGTAPATPAIGSKPGSAGAGHRMPIFRMAIEHLEKVKEHLQKAPHDFKGHREDAVKAVEEAIKQLRICREIEEDREEGGQHKDTGHNTTATRNIGQKQ